MPLAVKQAQQLGMPVNVSNHITCFLKQAEYSVQADLGVSNNKYSHSAELPLYGPGQGNKAALAIWTLVSCTLLIDCLGPAGNVGLTFPQPTQSIGCQRCINAYVDNTTL